MFQRSIYVKGRSHEIFEVVFLTKQLLLVPFKMYLDHLDFFAFLAQLLAFEGDSVLLATPPSRNSAVLVTSLSSDSAE